MSELRDWVVSLRPEARERDGVTCFGTLPLFVALGFLLDSDILMEIFHLATSEAALDPDDDDQTAHLETLILDHVGEVTSYQELLCVEWDDTERRGISSVSIVIVDVAGTSFLCLHEIETVPSFHAVVMGDAEEICRVVAACPELALPRIGNDGSKLYEVRVLAPPVWSGDDVANIVNALTGLSPHDGHLHLPRGRIPRVPTRKEGGPLR